MLTLATRHDVPRAIHNAVAQRRLSDRAAHARKRFAALTLLLSPSICVAAPAVHLQSDISAATITVKGSRLSVDVTLLASDFEEMFQRFRSELKGVDLSAPGILEIEIGRFVEKRIALRDRQQNACASKIERSGEDPANDEGVLVSLTFDCAAAEVVYDASRFLAAHGPRAWQVVTIVQGDARRQIMLNAESPPAPLSAPH